MRDVVINVARDYATHPIGREAHLWPFSGERFRVQYLEPPLRIGKSVLVDLRGTRGLAPSFLEEAFGGLVDAGFAFQDLERRLDIVTDDAPRKKQIWKYIRHAAGIDRAD
ncbi:STAS-like domain-containing protein [uncultured Brevundimonas sp.]|uniref:STAS-like domain-containing protein n=1 Tax=uncultured Brevundimonas sp. TaxID=213418 RepID=UPI0025FEADA1|nr:STAS-like domain-containing protein [uncultured Brevundimonas sp.]